MLWAALSPFLWKKNKITSLLLAEVTDSLFSKATGSWERWRLDLELLCFKDFLSFFSICIRNFDVTRECQISLESWQCEDSGNACQSALRGLDPELLTFKDFLSFFSICTWNFDVRRECQVSLETWQREDFGNACQSALRGLDLELLTFKDFLFFFLIWTRNFNVMERVPEHFWKRWQREDSENACQSALQGLDPGVIELQIFPFSLIIFTDLQHQRGCSLTFLGETPVHTSQTKL